MDGTEKIRAGIAETGIASSRSLAVRVEKLERFYGQLDTRTGEIQDEVESIDDDVALIQENDAYRAEAQNSNKTMLRTFAAFFAVASITTLLTLKVAGLVTVSLATVFIPALVVVALLALLQFMNDTGYSALRTLFDLTLGLVFAVVAALFAIPIAIIALIGTVFPPARNAMAFFLKSFTVRLERALKHRTEGVATAT
jgi:hypothetical protein